jgi:hypothetical protein
VTLSQVVVTRNGREGTILLDSGELVTGESMGAGNKLELKRNPVYFGKFLDPQKGFSAAGFKLYL